MSNTQLKSENKPRSWQRITIKALLVVVVIAFIAVLVLQNVKKTKIAEFIANMPEPANPVTVIQIEPQDWTPILKATGTVRPQQGAMLSAQSAGTIKQIYVQAGQQVKKGDLLVEIDSSVERATLNASQAQLPSAEKNYKRYLELFKKNSVSQAELDQMEATYRTLVANIDALKSTIERRQIYAPFDGIAGIVQVNVGQYITMGTPVVRVEDRSNMKVNFAVSQNNIEKIKLGQSVIATTDSYPDQRFNAKISAIEPAVDNKTGLVQVEATFESAQDKLLSGMFARLSVQLPTEHNQLVVPQVAVSYNMYGEILYVLEPLAENDPANRGDNAGKYRAKQVIVHTQDRNDIAAQLTASEFLTNGTLVVTAGQQNLRNNSLVQVKDKPVIGATVPTDKTKL